MSVGFFFSIVATNVQLKKLKWKVKSSAAAGLSSLCEESLKYMTHWTKRSGRYGTTTWYSSIWLRLLHWSRAWLECQMLTELIAPWALWAAIKATMQHWPQMEGHTAGTWLMKVSGVRRKLEKKQEVPRWLNRTARPPSYREAKNGPGCVSHQRPWSSDASKSRHGLHRWS